MKKLLPLIAFLAFASTAFTQVYQPKHWDGYLSVKVKNDSNISLTYPQEGIQSPFDTLISSFGVYQIKRVFKDSTNESLKRCYELRFSDSARMDTLIARLKNYPFLEYISKNGIGQYYDAVPDDSKYRLQWAMQKILSDSIWQLLPGDDNLIKIGVIDDAFLLGHEDLAAAIDTNYNDPYLNDDEDANGFIDDYIGWDFADDNNDVMPPVNVNRKEYSHGTHAAMIAAGVTNNDKGIASFNRGKLKVIPIKNAADNAWLPANVTSIAMKYAADMGAKVVSMSFESAGLHDSTIMAAYPNVIFVVAAGNSGNTSINTLGSYNLPNVLCIGASNPFDERAQFSNYGNRIDVMAPGIGILSGIGTGTDEYDYKSGTSYATPLVAGLCAAIWSYDSSLTAQQVIDRIKNTADNIDFENPAFIGQLGHGRINAYRAFKNITTQPHQAGFKTNKSRSLCVGDTLGFSARGYSTVQYHWDFGDGSFAISQGPDTNHTFTVAGNFNVSLHITNSGGDTLASNIFKGYVQVTDCPAIANDRAQWYFGQYGEIDFRSGRPVSKNNALTNTTLRAIEGSFTVNNNAGNLLFYGGNKNAGAQDDRLFIYNKNHQTIFTSADFNGTPTQGYICLPFKNRYFLLVTDYHESASKGVHLLIIDTTATSANVSGPYPILPYNMPVQPSLSSFGAMRSGEAITAIPKCNNDGYWILITGHENDNHYFDKVIVLELYDSANNASIRYHAEVNNIPGKSDFQAKLKASPNGAYIAISNQSKVPNTIITENTTNLYAFNNQTGIPDSLYSLSFGGSEAGLTFSPSSRVLYVHDRSIGNLYQLDLTSPNPMLVSPSLANEGVISDMLIGPDQKIYISYVNSEIMGVINFPDSLNTYDEQNKAGLEFRAVNLYTGTKSTNLPNMVDALRPDLISRTIGYRQKSCTQIDFFSIPACNTSIYWDFGDGSSSTQLTPSHSYAQPGSYLVKMVIANDTIIKHVKTGLLADISGDTAVCDTSVMYDYYAEYNDYYRYDWTTNSSTIQGSAKASGIKIKFTQSDTIRLIVNDTRTGCIDTSFTYISVNEPVTNNVIALDSQPCIAYLSGPEINSQAGSASYLWQISKDQGNWTDADTTVQMSYFVSEDSLFFRRKVSVKQCNSISNSIKVLAKPQIAASLQPVFICAFDSVKYLYIDLTLNNWDLAPRWLLTYRKDSGLLQYQIADSFLFENDTTFQIAMESGDTLYFATNTDCGQITSRKFMLPNQSSGNIIELDTIACAKGSSYFVKGSYFNGGLSYIWQQSLDGETWGGPLSYAQNRSANINRDSIYLRRIVRNYDFSCLDTSNVIQVYPRFFFSSQPEDDFTCWPHFRPIFESEFRAPYQDTFYSFWRHLNKDGTLKNNFFTENGPVLDLSGASPQEDSTMVVRIVETTCGTFVSDTARIFYINSRSLTSGLADTTHATEHDTVVLRVSISIPEMETNWQWQYSTNNGANWEDFPNAQTDSLKLTEPWCHHNRLIRVLATAYCFSPIGDTTRIIVNKQGDIWARDIAIDTGAEPHPYRTIFASPDIFVRNDHTASIDTNHQDPIYNPNAPNAIYVRARNRGAGYTREAKLYVYWTLFSQGEKWPVNWTENPNNFFKPRVSIPLSPYFIPSLSQPYYKGGQINQDPIIIHPLAPGTDTFLKVLWYPPNPLKYYKVIRGKLYDSTHLDICLLARILECDESPYGLSYPEVTSVDTNVRRNNNLITRNTTISNINRVKKKNGIRWTLMQNMGETAELYDLHYNSSDLAEYFDFGDIYVILDDDALEKWIDGGRLGSGFINQGDTLLKITPGEDFHLKGIELDTGEYVFIGFEHVMYDYDLLLEGRTFMFSLTQFLHDDTTHQYGNAHHIIYIAPDPIMLNSQEVEEDENGQGNNQQDDFLPIESYAGLSAELAEFQQIVPNPSDGRFALLFGIKSSGTIKVELLTLTGVSLHSSETAALEAGKYQYTYDKTNLSDGMYQLALYHNGIPKVLKLVIAK